MPLRLLQSLFLPFEEGVPPLFYLILRSNIFRSVSRVLMHVLRFASIIILRLVLVFVLELQAEGLALFLMCLHAILKVSLACRRTFVNRR